MKSIKLSVPADPAFDVVRDLDGTVAEVADPRGAYRYRRDDVSVDFEATGRTAEEDGRRIEVFQAVRVNA
ncbi:hypothetical protein HDA32_005676 [Spinactinospora alkalitolerans]|uniref:Uncharacterized protein n=1 Tax=Spinactinospora alkalitolerans TaxID=687207 RepID=A0A852U136_9ACTN|nr:hypothetical protein [Spinactinospora alkalitolerans]NYE50556.1 hypothetical protein [Spinactinospora alkalitolerans]